jgi:hypothetical protein
MPRDANAQHDVRLSLYPDALFDNPERLCAARREIARRIDGVEALNEQILCVRSGVGESPGDALIAPQHDGRNARQRRADRMQIRRFEMGEVPDSRHVQPEMRVVGEQRLATLATAARDHPVV